MIEKELMRIVGIKKYPIKKFKKAMQIEHEHDDLTKGDPIKTAMIVASHLKEGSNYYDELEKLEKKLKK